jgi:hypothetical protein
MSLKDSIETGMQDLKEKLSQAVQDSPIFQQIKAKYDELDANQKLAVTGGSASIVALVILFSVYQLGSSVRATKQDLADKNDLIRLLTTANDDLRRLRDEASASGMSRTADAGDQNTAWNAHLEGQALNAGIPKEAISISGEKPGTQGEQTKEALIDISLKKVNVRHLAKFAASLESGTKPIKIRSMVVDAKPDGSAWLDATLSISAFAMKNQ